MSGEDARYLETFGTWLRSLADDARVLASVLAEEDGPEALRRPVAGALNYLFKSLDLIDDGIEGLGYVDDAFVIRVAVRGIPEELLGEGESAEPMKELAAQADVVRDFLGQDYSRLEAFVQNLMHLTVRGRSVDALLTDAEVREELVADVLAWANRFEPPPLGRDEKNAVKLRSFLATKLGGVASQPGLQSR